MPNSFLEAAHKLYKFVKAEFPILDTSEDVNLQSKVEELAYLIAQRYNNPAPEKEEVRPSRVERNNDFSKDQFDDD